MSLFSRSLAIRGVEISLQRERVRDKNGVTTDGDDVKRKRSSSIFLPQR